MRDEPWPHGVFAVDRLPSGSGVPPMRGALQRRLPAARVLVLGPVLVHGVRAVHLSRKSARHRSVLTELAGQAVSHGHPRASLSIHTGRRQRESRLAHLRRFRTDPHCACPSVVRPRFLRCRTPTQRLCSRLDHHRSVSGDASVGSFPRAQVLVAIIRKELNLSASLYQILQVVSVTIFERVPILQALQLQYTGEKSDLFSNQLSLFNL